MCCERTYCIRYTDENVPMRLYERARELPADSRLPLHQSTTRLGLTLALVHVSGKGSDLGQRAVDRVLHVVVRRAAANELLELQRHVSIIHQMRTQASTLTSRR